MSGDLGAHPDADLPPAPPEPPRWVRPPAPPSRTGRLLGALAAVVVLIGAVLVVQATRDDGGTHPGATWDGRPLPPRGAKVDDFSTAGPPGAVDGFGTWTSTEDGWSASGGVLRSTGQAAARVGTRSHAVLVVAQVLNATTGSGIGLVSGASSFDGAPSVLVTANRKGEWRIDQRSAGRPGPSTIVSEPTQRVVIQLSIQDGKIKLQFDQRGYEIDLVAQLPGDLQGAVFAERPGTEIDLFGYLPLRAG